MKKIYLLLLAMICLMGLGLSFNKVEAAGELTVSKTSFSEVNGDLDEAGNITYTTGKGGGTSKPAIFSGNIRLYQNSAGTGGGYITLSAADGYYIISVEIGSSMATSVAYSLGTADAEKSANNEIAANGSYTYESATTDLTSITFHCMGTSSSSRLNVNKLVVVYKQAEIAGHTHSMVHHAEVPATCTEAGVKEYWSCDGCGKNYSDEAGTSIISNLEIEALGHDFNGTGCSRCDWVYVQNYVIESGAQYYIIADYNGTWYALNNGTYTDGVYAAGFEVKTSSAKQFSNLNELGAEQAWTFTQAGIDTYAITCGEIALSVTADNNGLVAAAGLESKFALSLADDGQVYLSMIDSNDAPRYLTGYVTNTYSNFRIYTSIYSSINGNGQYSQLKVVKVPSNPFETAQAKGSLVLSGDESNVTGLNVRFGGVISADMYKADAKYGVIVLPMACPDGSTPSKEDIASLISGQYAMECTPAEVEGGYQFAWVIDNLEANYTNYSSKFYVWLYMVDGDNVYISQCSIYTVNGIIDSYCGADSALSAEFQAVLTGLKQAAPVEETPAE